MAGPTGFNCGTPTVATPTTSYFPLQLFNRFSGRCTVGKERLCLPTLWVTLPSIFILYLPFSQKSNTSNFNIKRYLESLPHPSYLSPYSFITSDFSNILVQRRMFITFRICKSLILNYPIKNIQLLYYTTTNAHVNYKIIKIN